MAFANKIKIPFTVYGGVSTGDNGAANTLSGFTNKLTQFQFIADTAAEPFNYLSNELFVWDFGDGTTYKSSSADHVYKYPGHYIVSLVAYDSAGNEYLSTETKRLSVTDFIIDQIDLVTDDALAIKNLPSGFESSKDNPINLNIFGSTHTYQQLSASGYTISLYVSGTDSKKLPLSSSDKWQHLDNTWSFYKTLTADNGSIIYSPVNSVSLTVEPIYYESGQKFGAQFYRRVPLSAVDVESTAAVFVGVSGSTEFVYGDDTPKHGLDPVLIFTAIDLSNHSDYRQIVDGVIESDIRGDVKLPSIYGNFSRIIPARIRHRHASKLTFTSSGIRTMTLASNKWQCTEVPFFVDLVDENGIFTQSYAPLSGQQAVPGVSENMHTYVTNLSVVSSSDIWNTSTALISTNFYRVRDDQLPVHLDGKFRGYFIPYESTDTCKLQGKVELPEKPTFNKDVFTGSIGNPTTSEVNTMFIKDVYRYSDTVGGIMHDRKIEFVKTDTPTFGSPFCSSAIYETDRYSDNKVLNIWGGIVSNSLSAVNTYTDSPSSIYLPYITDKINKSVPLTTNSIIRDYSVGQSSSEITPTRVSFDSSRNAWITLSAGVFGMYADINGAGLISRTIGEAQDVAILAENEVIDGKDSLAPAFIESGKGLQYWIACSHPASGQVILGNRAIPFNMSVPIGNYANIQYVFEPKGIVPVDGVADNQGNLWVTTSNQQPELSWIRQDIQTISARAMSDDTIKYEYYTGVNNIASNYVLYVSGFTDDFFNGKFLVKSVTDNVVTVKPYEGKINNVSSTVLHEANIDSAIYADWVYKILPTGTWSVKVSGFRDPQFIVLDKYQNAWVGHDTNTVTKVTTAGDIEANINVLDTTFTNVYASAGTVYNYTMSADTHHLGGMSFDPYDNLLVINSFESKLYNIPTQTPTASSAFTISTTLATSSISIRPERIFGHHITRGDWTGYNWLNKYTNKFGTSTIEGDLSLTISPSAGKYAFAKINEDFDPIETIKSYRTQPITINKGKRFFDDFYGSIVGSISSKPTALGRVIYEKIANFTDNVADADTCNIDALYSICDQHDFQPKNYNYGYPGGLGRVMDFVSIPHKKAWGSRSKFDRDFHNYGSSSGLYGKNLGDQIDTTTGIITAGEPIVIRQFYNNEYKKVMPMYVSAGEPAEIYNSDFSDTVSYISDFSTDTNGWGASNGTATRIENYGGKTYVLVENGSSDAASHSLYNRCLTIGKNYNVKGKFYIADPTHPKIVYASSFTEGHGYAGTYSDPLDGWVEESAMDIYRDTSTDTLVGKVADSAKSVHYARRDSTLTVGKTYKITGEGYIPTAGTNTYTSDFSSDEDGWTARDGDLDRRATYASEPNVLRAFFNTTNGGQLLNSNHYIEKNLSLTVGKRYKITGKVYIEQDNVKANVVGIDNDNSTTPGGDILNITTKGEWVSFNEEFTAVGTTLYFWAKEAAGDFTFKIDSGEEDFGIKDIVVTEVGTNTYTSDFSSDSQGWTATGGNASSPNTAGGELNTLRFGSNISSAYHFLHHDTLLTPYKRYKITGDIYINPGATPITEVKLMLRDGVEVGVSTTTLNGWESFSVEFTNREHDELRFYALKGTLWEYPTTNQSMMFDVKNLVVTELGAIDNIRFYDGVDYHIGDFCGTADNLAKDAWHSFSAEFVAKTDYISFYMHQDGADGAGTEFPANPTKDKFSLKNIAVTQLATIYESDWGIASSHGDHGWTNERVYWDYMGDPNAIQMVAGFNEDSHYIHQTFPGMDIGKSYSIKGRVYIPPSNSSCDGVSIQGYPGADVLWSKTLTPGQWYDFEFNTSTHNRLLIYQLASTNNNGTPYVFTGAQPAEGYDLLRLGNISITEIPTYSGMIIYAGSASSYEGRRFHIDYSNFIDMDLETWVEFDADFVANSEYLTFVPYGPTDGVGPPTDAFSASTDDNYGIRDIILTDLDNTDGFSGASLSILQTNADLNYPMAVYSRADTAIAYHKVVRYNSVVAGKNYIITAKIYIPSGGKNIRGFGFKYGNNVPDGDFTIIHPPLDEWYEFSHEFTAIERDPDTWSTWIEFWMANSDTADVPDTFNWAGGSTVGLYDEMYIKDVVISDRDVLNYETNPNYVKSVGMLSSYPLSSYNLAWGWGLGETVTNETFKTYFAVYDHIEYYSNVLSEGIIDWTNSYTNLVESQSGLENWSTSNGIVESMIDYELRDGLGLFNTTISGDNRGIL